MKLDVNEVLDGLNDLEGLTPVMIDRGLDAGIGAAFKLADDKVPKVPLDKGDLKAGKVTSFVDIKKDTIKKKFGYDKPYAAKWHDTEDIDINWSEPGSGPKYLSSKLENYPDTILDIMGKEIKKRLKRGK